VLGTAFALYDRAQGWAALRAALGEAFEQDGTILMLLADAYADRDQDGRYASNSNEVIYAVNCLDRPEVRTLEELRAALPAYRAASPRFGEYIAWGALPCRHWPVRPTGRAAPVTAAGAAPILVVGTTRDPATPYAWAVALAAQLESGRLLTYEGDGHTAYALGSRCVDRAVERYLVDGVVPAEGTRCR
jgi:fermentation-respiration switch protein FrsA (DUF1100 family)